LVFDITRAGPIFVLGIMPRSGTNYLRDLLCLHPQCAPARTPISEDFFLEPSDLLLAYTREVRERWDPVWGVFDDELMRRFHESVGDGLVSFLWVDRDRRLVAKTPSVQHVDRFFTFFPRARLVILVRDGRSVVQSCMSTFGWELDRAARNWAAAADEIQRLRDKGGGADRYMLVKYEDLLDDLRGSLAGILRFLELDEDSFDFEAAERLPVRGSSSYFGPGRSSVHWEPVKRDPDFDPKERWRSWSGDTHERFEWIAGPQLRYFGYESVVEPIRSSGKAMRHRLLDWRWQTKTAVHRARVTLGTASRPLRERLGVLRPKS
jgi:hypothetical protein